MPKGRNKGFSYYMCKKFFHPSNPQNLERVFIAKQKLEQKEKLEKEKQREYEKEQETWNNRNLLSTAESKEKLALSFMYEPPAGVSRKSTEPIEGSSKTDTKDSFKFEWQRKAPRESYAKDDPNITDHPFGIQVQFTKCMKCQVWGHAHTDKMCPKYGKARDTDAAEIGHLDEKKLIGDMKNQGLQFTSYGAWDNGKKGGKQYDLIYSTGSEEEDNNDVMLKMLEKIRKKKIKKSCRSRKRKHQQSGSDSEAECKSKQKSSKKSRTKRKAAPSREVEKKKMLCEVDKILSTTGGKKTNSKIKSRDILSEVDSILFSSLAKGQREEGGEKREEMLAKVDKILSEDITATSDDDDEESEDENEDTRVPDTDSEDDLTESEMRLLNLIGINKIDVKMNFPKKYKDKLCHFCRQEEDTEHLAVCPVYDNIMTGSEFSDIKKSDDTVVVRKALANILAALKKRSQALSVTSLGQASKENMELLNIEDEEEDLPVGGDIDLEILNSIGCGKSST